MSHSNPFPAEGTIEAKENGFSANLPCSTMYVREGEDGTDHLQAAVDRASRKYGEGVEVRVRFTSRTGVGCTGYELLGPVKEVEA